MNDKVRWAILGTGDIAGQFAGDLRHVKDAELWAVGSRSLDRAEAFGDRFSVPKRYGSYEETVADPSVNIVYVATPHPRHRDDSLLAINSGKGVLCEKPFAINAQQALEMCEAATEQGVLLMEARVSHFFPAMSRVRALLAEDAVGAVRLVKADFCFRREWDPEHRLFSMEMGGGALLDVGIYGVALAQMALRREPESILSTVEKASTGVDVQSTLLFEYGGGTAAVVTCGSRLDLPQAATIAGTAGYIHIPPRFAQPDSLALTAADGKEQRWEYAHMGLGYAFEAEEACRCIRAGDTQSAMLPLEDTLAVMRTLDRVRDQWGLAYPFEQ